MRSRPITRCQRLFRSSSTTSSSTLRTPPTGSDVEALDAGVNALTSVSSERSTGGYGQLQGLSIAIKDNICTSSLPTTCSSAILQQYQSPFDATVVRLLRDAGAHIVGKTNCDEFGMGSLNLNSVHGPVINPFQTAPNVPAAQVEHRSAGGSSGGSAASVAAGICDAALGTDTGGSVRLPASYCGVVGLKPSYGIISRWGVISFADSLRLLKAFTHVDLDTVATYDPRDPTAATPDLRERARQFNSPFLSVTTSTHQPRSLEGLRIGIPLEYFPSELDPSIVDVLRTVLRRLEEAGATLTSVTVPATQYTLSAYYVIASAEASSNLARFDSVRYGLRTAPPLGATASKSSDVFAHSRCAGLGKEVQKRILLGTYALTADAFDNYFLQAQRIRGHVRRDFDRVFRHPCALLERPFPPEDGVDVLLHPSAIRTAPPLDRTAQESHSGDKAALDLSEYLQDIMTVPASLAGLPALSIPVGTGADSWPVGVSVVGQWGCDNLVMHVGKAIEELS
ncbi:amidase signature enzyme [Pisolithus orientalis]|uniref:amidase signature enzyme n=1 Tax=Pisolithus orientalis TaxID=936130 RepID=UPI00222565C7|nr:amidase signature enzyme [Pisolithus orientalis]KAI6006677.1 amidase signature enzyme [Pisolithus orientalis]